MSILHAGDLVQRAVDAGSEAVCSSSGRLNGAFQVPHSLVDLTPQLIRAARRLNKSSINASPSLEDLSIGLGDVKVGLFHVFRWPSGLTIYHVSSVYRVHFNWWAAVCCWPCFSVFSHQSRPEDFQAWVSVYVEAQLGLHFGSKKTFRGFIQTQSLFEPKWSPRHNLKI